MIRQLWVQADDYTAADDRLLFPVLAAAVPMAQIPQIKALRHPDDFALDWADGTHARASGGAAYIGWAGSLYVLVTDQTTELTFGAADASNARIDLVVGRVYDSEAGGPDHAPEVAVIAGQPGASPVAPPTPAGAMAFYEVRYNAGSTAPIVTDLRTPGAPRCQPGWRTWLDLAGDVWVSYPIAYNGAWKRADKWLRSLVSRAAAGTISGSSSRIPMDTRPWDPYGLYNAGAWGWGIPLEGMWDVFMRISPVGTAIGQFCHLNPEHVAAPGNPAVGPTQSIYVNTAMTGAVTFTTQTRMRKPLYAGDSIFMWSQSSGQTLNLDVRHSMFNFMELSYSGPLP